ncbi:PAP/25A-associated-like protein [Beauveria brongniartii RCEF 3172]|uniref:PAP/25A-associated-like protein n=1 Tax=Beauveria brongniartii RCEF 3172 TaxID=1081107 RepID=A0A167F302_9HYPO|nr:PAP/25A-associated-like protein [Beauveria brongniartii RCEF 3172]
MDTRTSASESKQSYPTQVWSTAAAAPSTSSIADQPQEASAAQTVSFPHIEFLPLWIPQQSTIYHAQLLHYNKLISPTRGGGLQTPPLPPVVTSPPVQTAPRSRTSSRASLKDKEHTPAKLTTAPGNRNRSSQNSDKNRLVITLARWRTGEASLSDDDLARITRLSFETAYNARRQPHLESLYYTLA